MHPAYKEAWEGLLAALDTATPPEQYVAALEKMVDELRARLDAGRDDLKTVEDT